MDQAQLKQAFAPEDLAEFLDLGQVRATAGVAAFVVRCVDLAGDGYTSAVWTSALDGSPPRQFTMGPSDNAPRWSPDGKRLAFISAREGQMQIQVIPRDGGEAAPLSQLPEGVSSMQWSDDGTRILAIGAVSIDPESRGARLPPAQPRAPGSPELAWRLPFKSDGVGYVLARTFHAFVIDANTGLHRQVTSGPFEVLAATWAPDGKRIAYTRTREGLMAHRTDLWICDEDGSNARQVTSDHATVMGPKWSPDGRLLVFSGARAEGDAQARLFVFDVASGQVSQVGDDDLEVASPEGVFWSQDGSSVVLIVARRACQHIVSLSVADGTVTTLVGGERHIAEVDVTSEGLVYFSETAASPRELFMSGPDGANERQLTSLNAWWWQRTPLHAEIRKFDVPDGKGGRETIEGWLVRAEGSTGPQPLMVEAHGGPNAFALLGYPWNTYWNVLCSRGWAVVVPHPVGSTSFGREFAERLNGHWGELDFPQYMAVVDALQADGTTDERVVIAGKSYGGYMAAWAIGHTHRFKAAIVAAPVANLESHFGTSDGGYYGQPYVLKGERHVEAERYRALSPVNYVATATTPTLLLQGKEDERCPRGQSEELFALLMRCGKAPCEMVMYPDGGHHFYETGKPSHRLDVVRRMTEWVERWTRG